MPSGFWLQRPYISLKTTILADVYMWKIDINIPKTWYILNKHCAHKVYLLLHTNNCLLTTILIVWWSGSDVLSILHPNMIVCCHLYIVIVLWFSYVVGNCLEVLDWYCNTLSFFPLKIMGNRLPVGILMQNVLFSGTDYRCSVGDACS